MVKNKVKKKQPIKQLRIFRIKFKLTFRGYSRFEYLSFYAKDGFEAKAAEVATEYVNRERGVGGLFYAAYRPPRTVEVTEITSDIERTIVPFKLEYCFFEATYANGRKDRNEWYELKN